MPIYEYHCQACNRDFEELQSVESRDSVFCFSCGARVDRQMSLFGWKWYNPFTKDGEGFTSVGMSKQEEMERVRSNAFKDD